MNIKFTAIFLFIFIILAGVCDSSSAARLKQKFNLKARETSTNFALNNIKKILVVSDSINDTQLEKYKNFKDISLVVKPQNFFPSLSAIKRLSAYTEIKMTLKLRSDFSSVHVKIFNLLKDYTASINIENNDPINMLFINRMRSLGPVKKEFNISIKRFNSDKSIKLLRKINSYYFNFMVENSSELKGSFLKKIRHFREKFFSLKGNGIYKISNRLKNVGKSTIVFSYIDNPLNSRLVKKLNRFRKLSYKVIVDESLSDKDAGILAGLKRLKAIIVITNKANDIDNELLSMIQD